MVLPLIALGGYEALVLLGVVGAGTAAATIESQTGAFSKAGSVMAEAGKEVLTTAMDYNLAITREALTAVGVLDDTASESGSDTRSRPVAGEVSDTDTNEDCNDCEPRKRGSTFVAGRRFETGDGRWPEYQLKIANMGGGPTFAIVGPNRIEEWRFSSVDFDGFWSASCTLVEAKYGYRQFLEQDLDGNWEPRVIVNSRGQRLDFMSKAIKGFPTQASQQYDAIKSNTPPAQLAWYFSDDVVRDYVSRVFLAARLPVPCIYEPF
ncbi:Tox-REase-5 domain-containing protein [Salinicola sp. CPA57]|uniref:Tox-REase-5 domain-containing protein n=1 Tax=Salinicola sp. CPA57 TaxID=1949080 RepID=UPI001300B17C|nr:Tox-REase-5 domain-containing protein [Salinicola sp. CPA57]